MCGFLLYLKIKWNTKENMYVTDKTIMLDIDGNLCRMQHGDQLFCSYEQSITIFAGEV